MARLWRQVRGPNLGAVGGIHYPQHLQAGDVPGGGPGGAGGGHPHRCRPGGLALRLGAPHHHPGQEVDGGGGQGHGGRPGHQQYGPQPQ